MRTLHRYITREFLIIFGMTLAVFTFVMCLGAVVKAVNLLARGVSGWLILKVFLYNVPFILIFSIPMSTLTGVLLLFGRLSFDGELTAMKASGLKLGEIIAPLILLSLALSVLCIYINSSIAPSSFYHQRRLIKSQGIQDPVKLLEEGRFVQDFPGLMIYIGTKDGNKVNDVVVYELDQEERVIRNIRARSGVFTTDPVQKAILIDLNDVRIDQADEQRPGDMAAARYISAQHYPVRLDFADLMKKKDPRKSLFDMTFAELLRGAMDTDRQMAKVPPQDRQKKRMGYVVEMNKRLALSISCFAFTLLGIPLGIGSKRKESSIGVGISLLLVFLFYFFIIAAESLVYRPHLRPDLIVWIPIVLAQIGAFFLLRRAH